MRIRDEVSEAALMALGRSWNSEEGKSVDFLK